MVSLALYSAVIVVGISTVVLVGTPILEDMRDSQAVDAAKDILTGMEEQVREVANAGEGSQTAVGLRFARGDFIFDADQDTVTYELETEAPIIGPHTSQQIGNLRLSSMAGVEVSDSTVNGQDCWKLENDHISTCIRKVPQNASDLIGKDTVGYWRFNENRGNTASDNSSYGNDGTINGSRWVDGKQDSGLAFDGTDDWVNTSYQTPSQDDFSISYWFKTTENNFAPVVSSWHGAAVGVLTGINSRSATQDGSVDVEIRDNSNGDSDKLYTDQVFNDGQWHHVVVTRDYDPSAGSGQLDIFVDGEDVPTSSADSQTADDIGTNLVELGRNEWQNEFFDGTLDEVRVWNRSLSTDEVQWLYEQGGQLDYIDTENLILRYYNKDEDEELNADFGLKLHTKKGVEFTNNGTGHVTPELTGTGLGRGRINANVKSFFGVDYAVVFRLLSGADFVQVDVEE